MKIKNKGLTALLLAGTMVITTPMASLATSADIEHDAGGSSTSGIQTGRGGDFSANISNDPRETGKIGIRLSLVDRNNPSEVISVDGNGNPSVVDYVFTTRDQFFKQIYGRKLFGSPYYSDLLDEFIFSTVKTQDLGFQAMKGGTGPDIIRKYTDSPLNYIDSTTGEVKPFSTSEIPPWLIHTGQYESRGTDFVQWCITNDAGVEVLGSVGGLFTVNVWGVQVDMEEHNGGTVANLEGAQWDYLDPWRTTEEETNLGKIETLQDIQLIMSEYTRRSASYGIDNAMQYAIVIVSNAYYALEYFADKYGTGSYTYTKYETNVKDATTRLKRRIQELGTIDFDTDWQQYATTQEVERQAKNGVSDEYAQRDTNTTGEGSGEKVSSLAHILTLLALTSDGHFILQTNSMREAGSSVSLRDATEDWVLMIEPIMWLTIFPQDAFSPGLHSKLYGTVSNIMESFDTTKVREWRGDYSNKKTLNWKAYQPAWGALHVKETYEFGNGQKLITPAEGGLTIGKYYNPGELAKANQWTEANTKVGYGVNVYWKSGLFLTGKDGEDPTSGDTSNSYIHTWDKQNYPGGDPAPAPDPSKMQEETKFGDRSKDFVITKWYVLRNTDAEGKTTETVMDVKTRRETPHTVVIENEGDNDSPLYWEVEKWATGKEALAPNDGDRTSNFEDYYKRNAGKYGGTYPRILGMTPEDTDRIVYVKLVAKQIITYTNPGLEILKVKDTPDGNTTVERTTGEPIDGKYDATEDGWTYLEDVQTPEPPVAVSKWEDVPGGSGTPGATPSIPVRTDTSSFMRLSITL